MITDCAPLLFPPISAVSRREVFCVLFCCTCGRLCRAETILFWEELMARAVKKEDVAKVRQVKVKELLAERGQWKREGQKLDDEIADTMQEHSTTRDSLLQKHLEFRAEEERIEETNSKTRLLSVKVEQLTNLTARYNKSTVAVHRAFPVQKLPLKTGGEGDGVSGECLGLLEECDYILSAYQTDLENDEPRSAIEIALMPGPAGDQISGLMSQVIGEFTPVEILGGLAVLQRKHAAQVHLIQNIDLDSDIAELKEECKQEGAKTLQEVAADMATMCLESQQCVLEIKARNDMLQKVNCGRFYECLKALHELASRCSLIATREEQDMLRVSLQLTIDQEVCNAKMKNAKEFTQNLSKEVENNQIQYSVAYLDYQALLEDIKKSSMRLTTEGLKLHDFVASLNSIQSATAGEIIESSITADTIGPVVDRVGSSADKVKLISAIPLASVDSITLPDGSSVLQSNLLINSVATLVENSPIQVPEQEIIRFLDGVKCVEDLVVTFFEKTKKVTRLELALRDQKKWLEPGAEFDVDGVGKSLHTSKEKLVEIMTDLIEDFTTHTDETMETLPPNHVFVPSMDKFISTTDKVAGMTLKEWRDEIGQYELPEDDEATGSDGDDAQ